MEIHVDRLGLLILLTSLVLLATYICLCNIGYLLEEYIGVMIISDDYEKMKAAALRRKEDDILAKWFVTAKEDVFIDIDPAYDRCNVLQGD